MLPVRLQLERIAFAIDDRDPGALRGLRRAAVDFVVGQRTDRPLQSRCPIARRTGPRAPSRPGRTPASAAGRPSPAIFWEKVQVNTIVSPNPVDVLIPIRCGQLLTSSDSTVEPVVNS